jgi:thioredoxin 1
MRELILGFIIALVASCLMFSFQAPDSQNGWNLANVAPGAGPDPIIEVNAGTFQGEVLDAHEPVLVEFFTQSCVHCNNMKPEMTRLANESQGYLRIYKVDSEANPALADRYEVQGVPTFVLFKGGKSINSTSGEMTKEELEKWVKRELDMPTT